MSWGKKLLLKDDLAIRKKINPRNAAQTCESIKSRFYSSGSCVCLFTGTQTHIWLLDTAPTLWIKSTNGPTIIYGNKFVSVRILAQDDPGINNKACPTLTSSIFLLNWSFSNHLGTNTTNTQSLIHTYTQLKGLLTQTAEFQSEGILQYNHDFSALWSQPSENSLSLSTHPHHHAA